MKTLSTIILLLVSIQLMAQTNYPLDMKRFVVQYDTACNGSVCVATKGQIEIGNDTIVFNNTPYVVTHKIAKDGVKFYAISVKSDLHQLILRGNYVINGEIDITVITPTLISGLRFPIKSIDIGDRKFNKAYVKNKD